MKLTKQEEQICDTYTQKDEKGQVRCYECPLNLTGKIGFIGIECYATINGHTSEAKTLQRYR